MKFHPLGDRVVLEMVKEAEKVGLIHLPQGSGRERSRTGIVVGVGPKARYCGMGDSVCVKVGAGVPIHDEKRELLLVGDGDVLARMGG